MIPRIIQESLFPCNTKEVLNELSVSVAVASQLFSNGFLSFDPIWKEELNALEYYELDFICRIFNSGLSLDSINVLLSKLDKPYCYDLTKVYYDFKSKDWRIIPVPEEVEELIENITEDEDFERLEEIKIKIIEIQDDNKRSN